MPLLMHAMNTTARLMLLTFAVLGGWALGTAHAASSAENCKLQQPPMDSGVNTNDGVFFYVYPRGLPSGYTGCQTMWDENGRKWWVIRFQDGLPKQMDVDVPSAPPTRTRCVYEGGRIVQGEAEACLDFKTLTIDGIRSIPKELEPSVPPGRDARKKSKD